MHNILSLYISVFAIFKCIQPNACLRWVWLSTFRPDLKSSFAYVVYKWENDIHIETNVLALCVFNAFIKNEFLRMVYLRKVTLNAYKVIYVCVRIVYSRYQIKWNRNKRIFGEINVMILLKIKSSDSWRNSEVHS